MHTHMLDLFSDEVRWIASEVSWWRKLDLVSKGTEIDAVLCDQRRGIAYLWYRCEQNVGIACGCM